MSTKKSQKKVGILTFHAPVNCGSFLQNWALQQQIKSLGFDVETINYSNAAQRYMYSTLNLRGVKGKKTLKGHTRRIGGSLMTLPLIRRFKKYNKDYRDFSAKHLSLSKPYTEFSQLNENKLGYDIYVVGSDQIWAPVIDKDFAYYLPFVKNHPKIAYAPSLGAKPPAKDLWNKRIIECVKDFDYLSSRETSGCDYIRETTGRKATEVLDPTLLLDKESFSKIEQPSGKKGKFIFFYCIGYEHIKAKKLAGQIRKKMKLPVVVWNPQEYLMDKILIGNCSQPKQQNPGVFLNLIKEAEIVLTTSFHGAALSAVYRKNFYMLKKPDHRQKTLLNLGIPKNHFIDRIEDFSPTPIDYTVFDKNIKKVRGASQSYLENALKQSK